MKIAEVLVLAGFVRSISMGRRMVVQAVILLNGEEVGLDRDVELKVGDKIQVGGKASIFLPGNLWSRVK